MLEQTDTATLPAAEVQENAEVQQSQQVEPKLSKELQSFLRKEAEFRKKEMEYKKQLEERDSVLTRYREIEEKGKEDPEYLLQAVGWDHDKISKFRSKNIEVSPEVLELRNEIKSLQERIEQREIEFEKKEQQKALDSKVSTFKSQINSFLSEKQDDYELINKLDKKEEVYSLIVDYWKENKKALSLDEAAKEVEERLKSQYEPLINSLKTAKKFANLFGMSEGSGETKKAMEKDAKIVTPTITAKDVGSVTSAPAKKEYKSREEMLSEVSEKLRKKYSNKF